jgi:hypothetical protein
MPEHDLYIFVRDGNVGGDVKDAIVRIAHDGGWGGTGTPDTSPDDRFCYYFLVPQDVPNSQGAQLDVTAPNKVTVSVRGLLTFNGERAYLQGDDFTRVDVPAAPPTPEPEPPQPDPGPTDPLERINAIYATGQYDLATKSGCGMFTEAVAQDFHAFYFDRGQMWGHIKKTGAQNQYNGHAVDAVQNLYGEDNGKWDIIVASVSSSAHPAFNEAGDANPDDFLPVSAVNPPAKKK